MEQLPIGIDLPRLATSIFVPSQNAEQPHPTPQPATPSDNTKDADSNGAPAANTSESAENAETAQAPVPAPAPAQVIQAETTATDATPASTEPQSTGTPSFFAFHAIYLHYYCRYRICA